MTHTPTDVRTALAARLRPYIDSALRWQASEDGKGQNLLTFHETADLIVGRMIDAIPADAQEPGMPALTAARPINYGCKPDGSCCDFCCGN